MAQELTIRKRKRTRRKKNGNSKGIRKRKQAIKILVYIAHKFGGKPENLERAKKITHDLQVADLDNTYICPLLTFSHLEYGEIGYNAEIENCLDLLSVCDKLIVASDFSNSKGVQEEIDFATLVKMEVEYLEDTK